MNTYLPFVYRSAPERLASVIIESSSIPNNTKSLLQNRLTDFLLAVLWLPSDEQNDINYFLQVFSRFPDVGKLGMHDMECHFESFGRLSNIRFATCLINLKAFLDNYAEFLSTYLTNGGSRRGFNKSGKIAGQKFVRLIDKLPIDRVPFKNDLKHIFSTHRDNWIQEVVDVRDNATHFDARLIKPMRMLVARRKVNPNIVDNFFPRTRTGMRVSTYTNKLVVKLMELISQTLECCQLIAPGSFDLDSLRLEWHEIYRQHIPTSTVTALSQNAVNDLYARAFPSEMPATSRRRFSESTPAMRGTPPSPNLLKTIHYAGRAMRELQEDRIGIRHLILGILSVESSTAYKLIYSIVDDVDLLVRDIRKIDPQDPSQAKGFRKVTFRPEAASALSSAMTNQTEIPTLDKVGTEHLLLGILSVNDTMVEKLPIDKAAIINALSNA